MIPAPLQNILDRLTVAWHERAIALKAISFALVGVVNTAIDFSVFWTTARYSGLAAGARQRAGLAGGGDSFPYAMNSFITFGPEFGTHLALARLRRPSPPPASPVSSRRRTTIVVPRRLSVDAGLCSAKLLSIAVSFAVNFSLSHFVVFRVRRPRGDAG